MVFVCTAGFPVQVTRSSFVAVHSESRSEVWRGIAPPAAKMRLFAFSEMVWLSSGRRAPDAVSSPRHSPQLLRPTPSHESHLRGRTHDRLQLRTSGSEATIRVEEIPPTARSATLQQRRSSAKCRLHVDFFAVGGETIDIETTSAERGSCKSCDCRPIFVQLEQSPVDIAQFGPTWGKLGRSGARGRPTSTKLDKHIPGSPKIGPGIDQIRQATKRVLVSSKAARHRPNSTTAYTTSTKLRKNSIQFGPNAIQFDPISAR